MRSKGHRGLMEELRDTKGLRDAPLPGDWADRAACRGMETRIFFPTRGASSLTEFVAEVCGGCPVLVECRTYALRYPVTGTWGGLTHEKRVLWRRAQKREAS